MSKFKPFRINAWIYAPIASTRVSIWQAVWCRRRWAFIVRFAYVRIGIEPAYLAVVVIDEQAAELIRALDILSALVLSHTLVVSIASVTSGTFLFGITVEPGAERGWGIGEQILVWIAICLSFNGGEEAKSYKGSGR